MKYLTYFRDGFLNLVQAKLRSFLAVLGIMVGTGSVVALLTTSELATDHAIDQFKNLGTHILRLNIHYPVSMQQDAMIKQQLTQSDIPKLKMSSAGIQYVAPYVSSYRDVYFNGKKIAENDIAITDDYFKIAKVNLESGRFIYNIDKDHFYCMLGHEIAKNIQELTIKPIIGQQIRIGNWYFTIVGVAQVWEKSLFIYEDLNNEVFIPLQTSYLMGDVSENGLQDLLIGLYPDVRIDLVKNKLQQIITTLLTKVEFQFRSPEEVIHMIVSQKATFTWLLLAIGSISLLVGGIGVMNIMLVSVVERKREIGIRMAIGAKPRDIHRMFLMEAILLTVGGGLMGVVMGLLVTFIFIQITHIEMHWHVMPLLLGFGVSLLIGVLSGFYPAMRAARLDPIATLRSDY